MRALNRKLLRNLWQLKGQGAAIAAVIGVGVAMFVMSFTSLDALRLSQESVYSDQRFADVFVSLKRAPVSLERRLLELPGVATLESRVQAPLNIPLENVDKPVTGLAISIPDGRQPQLNRLFIRRGQLPPADRHDQIVISEAFAQVHDLTPGDAVPVIINGRYQQLIISGIGLSPEFIYQIKPGDLFPDYERYAVIWMNRSALESAFNMEGAFNSLVISLSADSSHEEVITRLDLMLAPWGGQGAHDRDDQLSHRYLEQELAQLEAMAMVLPLIFIGVAAFLLNVVAARLIRTQREQIAVLKAFGYTRLAVAGHYLGLVLVVVVIGSCLGVLLGSWLANEVARLYQEFFRFPWLEFRLSPAVVINAILIAGGATVIGTLTAVYQAFRLAPAEAMRPAPPARYRKTLLERMGVTWLSQPARIIWRNLERQPVKGGLSILGIALAVGMVMVTMFQQDAIDHMMDVQFRLAQQQDATVTMTEPTAPGALFELAALPGVHRVEGFRTTPVILRYGHREFRTALQGYPADRQLVRVLDAGMNPVSIPEHGVLLTDHLAAILEVEPGDSLQVAVLEGRQPQLSVPVAGLVTEYIGVGAYMDLQSLTRLLGEADTVNGAFLAVDQVSMTGVNAQLARMPRIAGVTFRADTVQAFEDMMGETIIVFTTVSLMMAGLIAFAVVYNNARIAFAERGRELASLRVLGFTRREIAVILLGELLVLTLLALAPGFALGAGLCWLLTQAMQTDLFRIPLVLSGETFVLAALVVLAATLLSALIIGRSLGKLDMVSALKN